MAIGNKVAIVGGAYNPPHQGHIEGCEAVAPLFDEVWMMPCFAHTFNKKVASSVHRLAMCNLLEFKHKNIKVSSYELDHAITRGTINLLDALSGSYPTT